MVILDRREPEELATLVRRCGVEVAWPVDLEYGDACWTGNGPGGREIVFGCERKKLSDLVNSMRDRRLSGHQLRGMRGAYDVCLLINEGLWRPGGNGEIEEWGWNRHTGKQAWVPFYKSGNVGDRGAVSYQQLMSFISTLELIGGIVVRRTHSPHETAAQYAALWHWANDKKWESHHSHDVVYAPSAVMGNGRGGRVGMAAPREPTLCERMAMQITGIDRRAEAVAKHFGSVRAMANADPVEWAEIDGIGMVTARRAVEAIKDGG